MEKKNSQNQPQKVQTELFHEKNHTENHPKVQTELLQVQKINFLNCIQKETIDFFLLFFLAGSVQSIPIHPQIFFLAKFLLAFFHFGKL